MLSGLYIGKLLLVSGAGGSTHLARASQQLPSSPLHLGIMRGADCVSKPEVGRGEWSQSTIWRASSD